MKKTEKAEGFPGTDAGGQEGQTAEKPRRGRKPKAVKLKEEAAAVTRHFIVDGKSILFSTV